LAGQQVTEFYFFLLLFKGQITDPQRSLGFMALLFLLSGWFFGTASKNSSEIPVLPMELKVFKEFVERDLLTEVQSHT